MGSNIAVDFVVAHLGIQRTRLIVANPTYLPPSTNLSLYKDGGQIRFWI